MSGKKTAVNAVQTVKKNLTQCYSKTITKSNYYTDEREGFFRHNEVF